MKLVKHEIEAIKETVRQDFLRRAGATKFIVNSMICQEVFDKVWIQIQCKIWDKVYRRDYETS